MAPTQTDNYVRKRRVMGLYKSLAAKNIFLTSILTKEIFVSVRILSEEQRSVLSQYDDYYDDSIVAWRDLGASIKHKISLMFQVAKNTLTF